MKTPSSSLIIELYDLKVSSESQKQFGRVITKKALSEEDIIQRIAERGTEFHPSTIKAALELFMEMAEEELLNGASVTIGPAIFRLGMYGTFNKNEENWDPEMHKIELQVTPLASFKRKMEEATIVIRGDARVGPGINTFHDKITAKTNECITRGGAVILEGKRMKIAGSHESNGVELIHAETGTSWKIPVNALAVNYPLKVIFIAPLDLLPGEYLLKLTTQYSNSSTLVAEPRTAMPLVNPVVC
jgi:formylmethanofuran dehydrogenase subunit C